jgi:hypothetical protein
MKRLRGCVSSVMKLLIVQFVDGKMSQISRKKLGDKFLMGLKLCAMVESGSLLI